METRQIVLYNKKSIPDLGNLGVRDCISVKGVYENGRVIEVGSDLAKIVYRSGGSICVQEIRKSSENDYTQSTIEFLPRSNNLAMKIIHHTLNEFLKKCEEDQR